MAASGSAAGGANGTGNGAMQALGEIGALDAIGLVGAALYCTGYALSASDRLPSQSPYYYLLRLVAAVLVLIGVIAAMNPATLVIQIFFIVVSVLGLWRHAARRRAARSRGGGSSVVWLGPADRVARAPLPPKTRRSA